MKTYFDTSVAIALVFREPGWERTVEWLSVHADERLWSNLGWGEFTDVVARRARSKALSIAESEAILTAARAYFKQWRSVETSSGDIDRAAALIAEDVDRAVKLADAIHIATAHRHDAALLTHDRQQAIAARAIGLPAYLTREIS